MSRLVPRHQTSTNQPFFVLSWVLCGIALVLLIGRCYAAWKLLGRHRADLYLAITTFAIGVASMVMLTLGTAQGLGQHMSNLAPRQAYLAIMYGWINLALALIAIGLGKIAVVGFIISIQGYSVYDPWRSVFLWFLVGTTMVVNTIEVVLFFTQCRPIQKLFDVSQQVDVCPGTIIVEKFGIFQTSWSGFCDFTLALYPAVLFWNVHALSRLKRLGISLLFGLGVTATVLAALKGWKIPLILNITDATCELSSQIAIGTTRTEMWIVLIVGCLAPTMPLFRVLSQKTSVLFHVFRAQLKTHIHSSNT
ncbi:hypothetical protein ASPVEDRAFT_187353 [Aspergillus versicolor CBS 583.65]|uniref:Rhodopsin domain-containing protein n=1 Tax=Aspergillus versicolor CBS 583.65 TaxID=1036611 RepID=A0A1L9PCR1_ASPVE|nr:uncharacterized protein ASPVEDRAFT_187353 [Aspergillus versicolor CBS 583.65]OJI99310.1 hypothetical protein ASPVEDRAFT_187353 [Aspergillus versicolor CBS 583.65]